eukprot:m51a1_g3707 hypothetical protein (729) ;mRNA; r:428510-430871
MKRLREVALSLRTGIAVMVLAIVLLAAVPQWVAWYVCATDSTKALMGQLMDEIGEGVAQDLSSELQDAASALLALNWTVSNTAHLCDPLDPLFNATWAGLWRACMAQQARISNRVRWNVRVGGRHGTCASSYWEDESTVGANSRPTVWAQQMQLPNGTTAQQFGWVGVSDPNTDEMSVGDLIFQTGIGVYDARLRPWYVQSVARPGLLTWGAAYASQPVNWGPSVPVTTSFHDSAGQLCGVAKVSVYFADLVEFFKGKAIGKTGSMWLVAIDTDELVATSTNASTSDSVTGMMITVNDSSDALTRAVGREARSMMRSGSYDKLGTRVLNGKKYQVHLRLIDAQQGTGFPAMYLFVAIPLSDYYNDIQKSIYVTVGITLAALVVSLAASVALAMMMARPLGSLAKQIGFIASLQDIEGLASAPKSKLHEIKQIQDSMDKMWNVLQSFHKYVPIQVLRYLVADGGVAKLGVVEENCTIIFCDIENFTGTMEKADTRLMLQAFTDFMDMVTFNVEATHGIVDKIIGDCVMAFWGHFGKNKDRHQVQACQFALAVLRDLPELQKKAAAQGLPVLNCRIGIASGPVYVGNSGSSRHFQYTVLGSPVNLAARLEPLNKLFGSRVLVSRGVHDAVSPDYVTARLGRCAIKGFSEPEEVFELVAETYMATPEQLFAANAMTKASGAVDEGRNDDACELYESVMSVCPKCAPFLQSRCDTLRQCGDASVIQPAGKGL